jgi:release factor glutamine methyltransferase
VVVTTGELLRSLTARLADAAVPSPQADARWLVRHVLGWSAADLTLRRAEVIDDRVVALVLAAGERRAKREPLQLILGGTDFRGIELELWPGVFVPRAETELLAELASVRVGSRDVVVEPCTGSGAVACAIAADHPGARVLATDRDGAAAALARHNAGRLGLDVEVLEGWLLAPLPADLRGRIDVIVANPPYLADGEVDDLEPEVAVWDPEAALVAGPTGHEVSDALIAESVLWLRPGGWLVMEHDERRVDEVADRACAAGLRDILVHPDLTGRSRFMTARTP